MLTRTSSTISTAREDMIVGDDKESEARKESEAGKPCVTQCAIVTVTR
jgi:hypothetical protein